MKFRILRSSALAFVLGGAVALFVTRWANTPVTNSRPLPPHPDAELVRSLLGENLSGRSFRLCHHRQGLLGKIRPATG